MRWKKNGDMFSYGVFMVSNVSGNVLVCQWKSSRVTRVRETWVKKMVLLLCPTGVCGSKIDILSIMSKTC
jgi:hypothetical protein